MPGKRLEFDVAVTAQYTVHVDVGAGWATKASGLLLNQASDYVGAWVAQAKLSHVSAEKRYPSMECRVTYPKALGYLMMTQVLWVPDKASDMKVLDEAKFGKMTRFSNGWSVVDGGWQSPSSTSDEKPHKTYPFFRYYETYYNNLASNMRSYRAKDYASAAPKHTAIVFNCDIVVKLNAKDSFGVIASFSWGMSQHREIILEKRDGMTNLASAALKAEYGHCSIEAIASTTRVIDASYTPFEVQKGGKKGISKTFD